MILVRQKGIKAEIDVKPGNEQNGKSGDHQPANEDGAMGSNNEFRKGREKSLPHNLYSVRNESFVLVGAASCREGAAVAAGCRSYSKTESRQIETS
jgi:hypothetical protein